MAMGRGVHVSSLPDESGRFKGVVRGSRSPPSAPGDRCDMRCLVGSRLQTMRSILLLGHIQSMQTDENNEVTAALSRQYSYNACTHNGRYVFFCLTEADSTEQRILTRCSICVFYA